MNNNNRFMVFVVALIFGFGFSTVLKSADADLKNAIMVYERFKNIVQDDAPKQQFQAKRSAFILAIKQVLNPGAALKADSKRLVVSVLKVTDIREAQALMRSFINDNFPALIQPPAGPARSSRATAATSATKATRSAHHALRPGASAASAADPAAAAPLALPRASAAAAACAGGCDLPMFACRDAITDAVAAEAAAARPVRRSPFQRLSEYVTAPDYPAVSAAHRAERLAAKADAEPPVVGSHVPAGWAYGRVGNPSSWGIGDVRAATTPAGPFAPPPATYVAADADGDDFDGTVVVVQGSGLLTSGLPIYKKVG